VIKNINICAKAIKKNKSHVSATINIKTKKQWQTTSVYLVVVTTRCHTHCQNHRRNQTLLRDRWCSHLSRLQHSSLYHCHHWQHCHKDMNVVSTVQQTDKKDPPWYLWNEPRCVKPNLQTYTDTPIELV